MKKVAQAAVMIQNGYLKSVIDATKAKNASEPEFIQAMEEVLSTIEPIVSKHEEEYKKEGLLERLVEPERIISLRVHWIDDKGKVQVNRGYRVQFNGEIGADKGGLRCHHVGKQSILQVLGV